MVTCSLYEDIRCFLDFWTSNAPIVLICEDPIIHYYDNGRDKSYLRWRVLFIRTLEVLWTSDALSVYICAHPTIYQYENNWDKNVVLTTSIYFRDTPNFLWCILITRTTDILQTPNAPPFVNLWRPTVTAHQNNINWINSNLWWANFVVSKREHSLQVHQTFYGPQRLGQWLGQTKWPQWLGQTKLVVTCSLYKKALMSPLCWSVTQLFTNMTIVIIGTNHTCGDMLSLQVHQKIFLDPWCPLCFDLGKPNSSTIWQ